MSEQHQNEFGSLQATQRIWLFFDGQTQLLKRLHSILMDESGKRWSTLIPLSYSIQDSCETISLLAQHGKVRDCFVIARTIFETIETIINFCFICSEGDEVVARAEAHAMQKAYRDLHRELEVNQHKLIVQWSGQVDLSSNPELRVAIDEFTNSKGHEKRSWTPESVKQRIEALESRYGTKVTAYLQIALLSIYRHASEIAHGTLSGALFALGFTLSSGPPKSPEVLANHQRGNITMLLMVLGFSIFSLLRVVANELPLEDIEDLIVESDTALNKLTKEGWAKTA